MEMDTEGTEKPVDDGEQPSRPMDDAIDNDTSLSGGWPSVETIISSLAPDQPFKTRQRATHSLCKSFSRGLDSEQKAALRKAEPMRLLLDLANAAESLKDPLTMQLALTTLANISTVLQDVDSPPAPPLFPYGEETILTLHPENAIVLNVVTPKAFGYEPVDLIGSPFFTIANNGDQHQFLHALQVLIRMDMISKMSANKLYGEKAYLPPRLQAIRLIHRVIVGLAMPDQRPELVTLESLVTTMANETGGTHCLMRSRRASGLDAADGTFRMLPALL